MKKQPEKNDPDGEGSVRHLMARALESERLAEAAHKVMHIAKARFKDGRKALKVAKKAAKKARKDAKVAAKEWKNKAKKAATKAGRASRAAKAPKPQIAKDRSASTPSVAKKRGLDPSLVTTVVHSAILPAITMM